MKDIFHVEVMCNPTVDYQLLAKRLELVITASLMVDETQGYFDYATVKVYRKRFVRVKLLSIAEKTASDAPAWYSAEAADSWADGYNKALEDLK